MDSEPLTQQNKDRTTWKAAPGMINSVVAERYEILEEIGVGPLLRAFRARDRALNRVVVLKTPLGEYKGNMALADQLRDGLSQVLSLSHTNIVRSYDIGVDEANTGIVYLVEEFVRGVDLKDRIRRFAPFSLPVANDVAIALAEALEFAHARGIAHGDLRPQNVMVSPEGQIKLTGFGSSAALPLARLESPERFTGSNLYTPPNVSGAAALTASADLYALGVILFEMLTGDLPPREERGNAGLTPPTPRTLNSSVPRALEGIVLKALSSVPRERYASAAQMLLDLRAVRDALRYGKSLAWSPMDQSEGIPSDEEEGTVLAPLQPPARGAVETVVMPVRTPPVVRRTPPPAPVEERIQMPVSREEYRKNTRSSTNRWLTALNLFLFILVLGGLGSLAWMTSNYFRPLTVVVVPNLVGKSISEAESLAVQQKFVLVKVDSTFRDKEPKDIIYQMSPAPGRQIREGKPVQVYVSKGPKLVEVPDLRDVSVEKARRLLEGRGLRLGEVTKEYDALMAKGNVLSQKPDFGDSKPLGTRVNLVLSNGEKPQEQPVLVPPDTNQAPPLPDDSLGVTENKGNTDTGTNNPDNTNTSNGGNGDANMDTQVRFFDVKYSVPKDGKDHRIRIDVIDYDSDNAHTEYDEDRKPGDSVLERVQGVGRRITIRLFDNDERRKDIKI